MRRICVILVFGMFLVGPQCMADEGTARAKALAVAEERLKAIYEKRDFAPASFQGKWLADSSGYMMLEPSKPGAEPELVKYDAKGGKQTIFIGSDKLVEPGKNVQMSIKLALRSPRNHARNCTTPGFRKSLCGLPK